MSTFEGKIREETKIVIKIVALFILLLILLVFFIYFPVICKIEKPHFFLAAAVFVMGASGAFLGIIQEYRHAGEKEWLNLTSSSFTFNYFIPSLVGGGFALVLMTLFSSGIIEGTLFPNFSKSGGVKIKSVGDYYYWVTNRLPDRGYDIAKLWVWSFLAGYSARLVPNLLAKISKDGSDSSNKEL